MQINIEGTPLAKGAPNNLEITKKTIARNEKLDEKKPNRVM